MHITTQTLTRVFTAIALVGLLASGAAAQERETFTGMLAQMSGVAAGATGTLSLTIDRWSTPEERNAYLQALLDGKD